MRAGERPESKKSKIEREAIAKTQFLARSKTGGSDRRGAAVPISLYREVAIELELNKARVFSLSEENKRLKDRNQLLRQEVQYLLRVQSASLASTSDRKKIARSFLIEPKQSQNPIVRERGSRSRTQETSIENTERDIADNFTSPREMEKHASEPNEPIWTTETGQVLPNPSPTRRAMNGWLLGLAIVLIIGTAFTAGFLLVRPLIEGNNDN
jgi:hypothetical protein